MTFAMGRRFVIADGVERWKEAEVDQVASALASADPETLTVAFFAREEGRYKAPPKLHEAVKKVGGQIAAENNVKSWDLPKWLIEQAKRPQARPRQGRRQGARRPGRRAPAAAAARAREARARARPGRSIGADEVEESCATSAERKVWTLADALVAGDQQTSLELLLELRQQGERVTGLIYNMVRRLRDAVAIADALAGRPGARAGQEDAADAAARRGQVRQGRRRARASRRCGARSPRCPTSRPTPAATAAAGSARTPRPSARFSLAAA